MTSHVYNVELFENRTRATIPPFTVELDNLAHSDDPDDPARQASLEDLISDHVGLKHRTKYPVYGRMIDDNTCIVFKAVGGWQKEIGRADVTYQGKKTHA